MSPALLARQSTSQRNHCHRKNRLLSGDFHTTNNVKQDFTVYVRLEEPVSLTFNSPIWGCVIFDNKKSIRKEYKSIKPFLGKLTPGNYSISTEQKFPSSFGLRFPLLDTKVGALNPNLQKDWNYDLIITKNNYWWILKISMAQSVILSQASTNENCSWHCFVTTVYLTQQAYCRSLCRTATDWESR